MPDTGYPSLERFRALQFILLVTCLVPLACSPKQTPPPSPSAPLWKSFSGEKAFEFVRQQVALGPRPSGSDAIQKAREHIIGNLRNLGWDVEEQAFDASPIPSREPIHYVNIIGRFPTSIGQPASMTTQHAIVGSHYDTKHMVGVEFVGANDGGSSTGALLELARVASQSPGFAQQLELVFFDGEEALERFGDAETGPDGLVGSRHYASELRRSGRFQQFRFAIVWDMIGDKDLNLTLPSDTPPALAGPLFNAAATLGHRKHVGYNAGPILDDHEPIIRIARIPAMDMIDFDYGPWHTASDTLDKLSPESLQIVGQLTLWVLERELNPAFTGN